MHIVMASNIRKMGVSEEDAKIELSSIELEWLTPNS